MLAELQNLFPIFLNYFSGVYILVYFLKADLMKLVKGYVTFLYFPT